MAPMKRPAASQATPASLKKPSSAAGATLKKCKAVAEAVSKAENYPADVLKMLSCNIDLSLGVVKEERHQFQEQVAAMVGEVLSSVEASLTAAVKALEARAGGAGEEKAAREAAAEAAKTELDAKAEAEKAAKAAVTGAASALKAAKATVAGAESAQREGDAELEDRAASKVRLEAALTEAFEPLKTGTKEPGAVSSSISGLAKLGREFSVDSSLLSSLGPALSKLPDQRGSFDNLVVTQVEDAFAAQIAALGAVLAAGEAGKAERAAKVAAANADLTAAADAETTAKAALEAAKVAAKEAEAASKDAAKALKSFEPDMKEASKNLETAKGSLQAFTEGALAAYSELLVLSSAPPPEPPAPAEEETAAPAAEAAAAAAEATA